MTPRLADNASGFSTHGKFTLFALRRQRLPQIYTTVPGDEHPLLQQYCTGQIFPACGSYRLGRIVRKTQIVCRRCRQFSALVVGADNGCVGMVLSFFENDSKRPIGILEVNVQPIGICADYRMLTLRSKQHVDAKFMGGSDKIRRTVTAVGEQSAVRVGMGSVAAATAAATRATAAHSLKHVLEHKPVLGIVDFATLQIVQRHRIDNNPVAVAFKSTVVAGDFLSISHAIGHAATTASGNKDPG